MEKRSYKKYVIEFHGADDEGKSYIDSYAYCEVPTGPLTVETLKVFNNRKRQLMELWANV